MPDRIGGIPYNPEKDGDLRFLVDLLINNQNPKNTFRGRKINQVLRMLLSEKLNEKLIKGELKDFVTFCSAKSKLPVKKCTEHIFSGQIDKKLVKDWLETTKE